MGRARPAGFTLLEILVALAVTAVLLAAIARAMPTALAARKAAVGALERATTASASLDAIERELATALPEPIVLATHPATRLEFTGGLEPGERITYSLERGTLVRRAAPRRALDAPGGTGRAVLHDVAALDVAAFDGRGWMPTWADADAPAAIRLRVVFTDGETIETVAPIPIAHRRGPR
jgi:prepilin-type N-terminal cleavage/methylation domain-containing protein